MPARLSSSFAPSSGPPRGWPRRRAPLARRGLTAPGGERNASWTPPVPGKPTRLFDLGVDPFTRGQHRGVDLDAAPGERVRSACGGRVVFAGRVAGAGTVSVRLRAMAGRRTRRSSGSRCGPVCASDRVEGSGGSLGTSASDGGGPRRGTRGNPRRSQRSRREATRLHLGVRRESERFGYVDPLGFLAAADRAPPPVVPARLPRPAPRATPVPRPARPSPGVAPWPVWVGLALLMTGLVGAGTLRFPLRKTGGAACRASSTSSSSPTTPSSP